MSCDYDYQNLLYEARSRVIQVSSHPSYLADVKEEYVIDEDVVYEVKVVIQLFKDEDYSTLKREYNDHALTRAELSGFRSLHLFPRSTKNVVLVYKSHKKGTHIVFHRIGSHDWIYNPGYEKMDKNRQMKKR